MSSTKQINSLIVTLLALTVRTSPTRMIALSVIYLIFFCFWGTLFSVHGIWFQFFSWKKKKKKLTHESVAEVSRHIFITDGSKAPEGVFCGHLHEQHCCHGGVGLAIAIATHQGVHLQHLEQVLLPGKHINIKI